jgi:hypothetical protein
MFNVKISDFLSKLTNNKKKEQKYLKKLLNRIEDNYDKETLEFFLNATTFEDIKDFLEMQRFIQYEITPEDFEGTFNDLKEKIAYELNEAILKNS